MQIFGDPEKSISESRAAAGRVNLAKASIPLIDRAIAAITPTSSVCDCGKSSREGFAALQRHARVVETLDIAKYGDYPDIQFDLSANLPDDLKERYDIIYCASILEHVHDPFSASRNLLLMLKPGGKIFGHTPWLFPYHGLGGDYEDFWRLSPDAYGILFREAQEILVYANRGRIATAALVASYSWKHILEKRVPTLAKFISGIATEGRHMWQSSGYDFVISK